MVIDGNSQVFYNHEVKNKTIMKRMDVGIPNITRTTNRKSYFGNMYVQDGDFTPDHYDSVKIANDLLMTKAKVKAYVNMKKQTKRDYTKLLSGNDFFANI